MSIGTGAPVASVPITIDELTGPFIAMLGGGARPEVRRTR